MPKSEDCTRSPAIQSAAACQAYLRASGIVPRIDCGCRGNAGDAGVKRLARGVDAAVHTLHDLLVDVMQPGLEALAFTLSDTAGLARCSPWTGPISLKARVSHSTLADRCTCVNDCSATQ